LAVGEDNKIRAFSGTNSEVKNRQGKKVLPIVGKGKEEFRQIFQGR